MPLRTDEVRRGSQGEHTCRLFDVKSGGLHERQKNHLARVNITRVEGILPPRLAVRAAAPLAAPPVAHWCSGLSTSVDARRGIFDLPFGLKGQCDRLPRCVVGGS